MNFMHSEVMPMGRKRGRPRLNRPKVDEGTPELRARRAAVTRGAIEGAKDPAYAEHPLGVLLMQGILSPEFKAGKALYDAGIYFASLWIAANPKAFPTGTLGRLQPGSSVEVAGDAADQLKALCAHLAKERAVYDAVVNTCVYRRLNLRNMEKLRTGLARVSSWRRLQRSEAAAAE
jgi:hypothetical protein